MLKNETDFNITNYASSSILPFCTIVFNFMYDIHNIWYSGPAKWISKCRGQGTLKSIVGHHGWTTRKIFEF